MTHDSRLTGYYHLRLSLPKSSISSDETDEKEEHSQTA